MKKKLLVCVLAIVMLFSMAVPAVAATPQQAMPVSIAIDTGYDLSGGYVAISPFNEETRIYWRTLNGVLQFRVWGITSGRWLTPWTNF